MSFLSPLFIPTLSHMMNFWKNINKPIYALAPMAGITDSAFRQMCKKFGADVLYSEMASSTALFYSPDETLELLRFEECERPYVVQLFGSRPEHFAKAAKIVEEKLRPDGIDINFGCPVPKVIKQGAGCALMDEPELAKEVIMAVLENTNLPVSIKTRTKTSKIDLLDFLKLVDGLDIKALMIHARTQKQGFLGSVDHGIVQKAREFFKGVILFNGGIQNDNDSAESLESSGADGLGIARGALGKPWIFEDAKGRQGTPRDAKFVFETALKHARLAYRMKGDRGIIEMRKHLCWYVQGMPGARRLRERLVRAESLDEISSILGPN